MKVRRKKMKPRNHLVKHVVTRGGAGKHRNRKREQKINPPKEIH